MPQTIPGRIRDTLAVFNKDRVINAAEQRALVELAKNDKGKITTSGKHALVKIHNEEKFESTAVKGRLTATLLDAGVKSADLSVPRSADLSKFERLSDAKKLSTLFPAEHEPATDPWGNDSENVTYALASGFRSIEIGARQLKGDLGSKAAKLLADAKQEHKELLADWNEYDRDAGRDRHPNSIDAPTLSAIVKNGETYGYVLAFTPKASENATRRVLDTNLKPLGDVYNSYADM